MSKNNEQLVISATIVAISAIMAFGMFFTTVTVNAQLPGMNPTQNAAGTDDSSIIFLIISTISRLHLLLI